LGAAGVFLVVALVAVLVAVFLAAGAFFVVALVAFVVFLASAGDSSFLAVFLAAAGLAADFASFTGPEGPMHRNVSDVKQEDECSAQQHDGMHGTTRSSGERRCHTTQTIACCIDRIGNIPLGRSKVPFSEPLARARLKREVKVASLVVSPKALFIQTNFLRDWRLLSIIVSKDVPK
jgi:hypothetical protein